MEPLKQYQRRKFDSGLTRIEILLKLYDRLIGDLEMCREALDAKDDSRLVRHQLDTHKAMTAILSGLRPNENEVAFNIARLLHFIMQKIDQDDYEPAIKIANTIQSGFRQIADQAIEMEQNGEIEPLPTADSYESVG